MSGLPLGFDELHAMGEKVYTHPKYELVSVSPRIPTGGMLRKNTPALVVRFLSEPEQPVCQISFSEAEMLLG